MSGDSLDLAGQLSEAMRGMSDLLKGAVATLVREGWTEEQARQIVISVLAQNGRGVTP